MRPLMLLLTLVLCSCGKFYLPPSPPEYGPDCRPSDPFYEDLARRERDIKWALDIPDNPKAALAYCEGIANDRGWTFTTKIAPPTNFWGSAATTGSGEIPIIPLPQDFDSREVDAKARTICHEVVHTFQWERDTVWVMLPTYALNEGTFAYEIPAYRVNLWLWSLFTPDATPDDLERKAIGYVNNLFAKYKLDNNLPVCMRDTGVNIMLEGMD